MKQIRASIPVWVCKGALALLQRREGGMKKSSRVSLMRERVGSLQGGSTGNPVRGAETPASRKNIKW